MIVWSGGDGIYLRVPILGRQRMAECSNPTTDVSVDAVANEICSCWPRDGRDDAVGWTAAVDDDDGDRRPPCCCAGQSADRWSGSLSEMIPPSGCRQHRTWRTICCRIQDSYPFIISECQFAFQQPHYHQNEKNQWQSKCIHHFLERITLILPRDNMAILVTLVIQNR